MKKYFLLCHILLFTLCGFAQLKIGTGSTFKTSGTVSVVLTDADLENNGSFIQDTFGSLRFSGIQNAGLKGTAQSKIGNLQMVKANNSKLMLSSHVSIGNKVSFVSGLIDLNGFNMLLDNTANIIGESEANRFIGANGGYIETTRNLSAPSVVNPGNLGAFISTGANLGAVTIRRGHKVQSGTGLNSSVSRYYTITPQSNARLTASIRLSYFDAEKNNLDENLLEIFQSNNSGLNWNNLSQTARNTTLNYVEKSGVTTLSTFTLGANLAAKNKGSLTNTNKQLLKEMSVHPSKLTVGPNPNNGYFFFQLNGIEQPTPAMLYTIDGKMIGQYKVNDGQRQQVSGLQTGVYFLKVAGLEPYKVIVQGGGNK